MPFNHILHTQGILHPSQPCWHSDQHDRADCECDTAFIYQFNNSIKEKLIFSKITPSEAEEKIHCNTHISKQHSCIIPKWICVFEWFIDDLFIKTIILNESVGEKIHSFKRAFKCFVTEWFSVSEQIDWVKDSKLTYKGSVLFHSWMNQFFWTNRLN